MGEPFGQPFGLPGQNEGLRLKASFFKSWWWLLLGRAPNWVDVLLGDASLWLIQPWKQVSEKPFIVSRTTWHPVSFRIKLDLSNNSFPFQTYYIYIWCQLGQTFETNLFLFHKKGSRMFRSELATKNESPFFENPLLVCVNSWCTTNCMAGPSKPERASLRGRRLTHSGVVGKVDEDS